MTHLPDMTVLMALCDEYGPDYVREHFFDGNGVKDSAPEELKTECRSDKTKYDRSSNCL